MARIESMTTYDGGAIISVTTHGITVDVHVVATNSGYTIGHYDRGDRWVAVLIADFGDGNEEFYESAEGNTFGVSCKDEFVVRRTDNAGSLKWTENE